MEPPDQLAQCPHTLAHQASLSLGPVWHSLQLSHLSVCLAWGRPPCSQTPGQDGPPAVNPSKSSSRDIIH